MSAVLIPLTLFVRPLTTSFLSTAVSLPFFVLLVYVLGTVGVERNDLYRPQLSKKVIAFVLLGIAIQMLAILASFGRYGNSPQDAGLAHGLIDLFALFITGILAYYATFFAVRSVSDIRKFECAVIVAFLAYSVIVLIPQIFASMSPLGHRWVDLLASVFERRWPGRDWYTKGSYATTMHRVNGFEAEAGYLAALIGCVFVPPVIAAIHNHYDYFSNTFKTKRRVPYFLVLGLMIVVLFFAKTTTGFLVIALIFFLLFFNSDRSDKRKYYLAGICLVFLIALSYIFIPQIRGMLNTYLFQKGGTDNRLGGTLGLLLTFVHHPIIGVGNEWTGSYIMQYAPAATKTNYEFLTVYAKKAYPILSVWGGWLAQFGLVLVVPVIIYVYRKLKRALSLEKRLVNSTLKNRELFLTILDSFQIFLVMYFVLSILIFSWNEYYMLISFFFYTIALDIIDNELNKGELNEY
ncbi:hypothetical protein [Furfurilactobacillus cerevisiae]|uniref:hypothetical protein n=1 Tax=Furfurilactobacillus rossiae TaxID=231049 RepID=UPI003B9817D9